MRPDREDSPVAVVRAWQEAVNAQDLDRLLELSDPQIEVVGPRGSGHGHPVLRDWVARAGLRLTPQRVFARGDQVVVAQHGVWQAGDSPAIRSESDFASRFRVAGGRITQFARYDRLDAALAAAGLTAADAVPVA